MKHAINEWQDMGLKKDVENITKELQKNKTYEKPLILELYIAIVTLIIDKIFDYSNGCEEVKETILWILFGIASAIFIYAVVVYIKDYWATRSKIKSSVINIKPYVDSFDNNICYYALTASNFYESLVLELGSTENTESPNPTESNKEKCRFYYIEIHYYINKCISEFSKMENIFKDIFTNEADDVIFKSKIHFSRLKNIVDLLSDIRIKLDNNLEISNASETNQISKKYDEVMNKFIKTINVSKKFSSELKWIEKTSDTSAV